MSTQCTQSSPALLTAADRALAISRSKAVAFRFAEAVKARDSRMVRAVLAGLAAHEVTALAIVLAEAVNPLQLKVVKDAEDDGLPSTAGTARRARPESAGHPAGTTEDGEAA